MCTHNMAFLIPFIGAASAMKNEGVDLKSVFGKDVGHGLEMAIDLTNPIRVPLQTAVLTPLLTTLGVPTPIASKITSRITGGAGTWDEIKSKAITALSEISPDLAQSVDPILQGLDPQKIHSYAEGGLELGDVFVEDYYTRRGEAASAAVEERNARISASKATLMEARRSLNNQYIEGEASSIYGTPVGSRRSSVYYPDSPFINKVVY